MKKFICPWWFGYFLLIPFRRYAQDPDRMLRPYVKPGMTAMDVGPGMGFFSLPMARLVGDSGRVICVDLQEKMIRGLKRRAAKAGLLARMELRVCTGTSLCISDLASVIDFALASAVVHEVPDAKGFFSEVLASLKQGGRLLFSEPRGHVGKDDFDSALSSAREAGFVLESFLEIPRSRTVLLRRGQP